MNNNIVLLIIIGISLTGCEERKHMQVETQSQTRTLKIHDDCPHWNIVVAVNNSPDWVWAEDIEHPLRWMGKVEMRHKVFIYTNLAPVGSKILAYQVNLGMKAWDVDVRVPEEKLRTLFK